MKTDAWREFVMAPEKAACGCGDKLGPKLDDLHTLLMRYLAQHSSPAELYETTIGATSVVTVGAAATTAVHSIGPPPQGMCWYVEVVNKHASTGTAVLKILVGPKDNTDDSFRRDFSTASADDVASENPAIYVGPSEFLVAAWSSASNNAVLTVSYQIRVHRFGQPFGARE